MDDTLTHALHDAVRGDSLDGVRNHIRAGADVSAAMPDGLTPLMVAAAHGQARMVTLLLEAGAQVNVIDTRAGTSALHKATLGGNPEVVAMLLDAGAFIDQQIPMLGHTALMDAVVYKHAPVIELLLSRGARTSIRNHWGETPSEIATRDELPAIVEMIARHDATVAAAVAAQPLVAAILAKNAGVVADLIAGGADVNARVPMTGKPDDDYTPLAIAAREGNTDIVRMLRDAGADPRPTIGLFGGTALHEAAYFGHADAIRAMTEPRDRAGGLLPDLHAQGALNGLTALHDAVWHGHFEASQALVEAGHPLHLRTHAGLTARGLAELYGYDALARYLADAEANHGSTESPR